MRRILLLIGVIAILTGCASTGSVAVRTVTDSNIAQATKSGIIDALDGGLFGRMDSEPMKRADRMLALEAEYKALEHTPAGQSVPWKSERSELVGEVIASQPYRVGSQDCRPYRHTITNNGQIRSARGTACRNSDGSWTLLT